MLLRPGVQWCVQGTTAWVRCARAMPMYGIEHELAWGEGGVIRRGRALFPYAHAFTSLLAARGSRLWAVVIPTAQI